jgi:hypothetical protein
MFPFDYSLLYSSDIVNKTRKNKTRNSYYIVFNRDKGNNIKCRQPLTKGIIKISLLPTLSHIKIDTRK